MTRSIGKQSGESAESVRKKEMKAVVCSCVYMFNLCCEWRLVCVKQIEV